MTRETSVGMDVGFFTSPIGLFKVGTFILALICLCVLSATQFWVEGLGLAALQASNFTFGFITATQLISIVIYFFKLYNVPLVSRLPWKLLEFVYAVLCAVLLFISMAICAWGADRMKIYDTFIDESFIACAVFAALMMVLFAVFAFFTFRSDSIRSEPKSKSNPQVEISGKV